MIISWEKWIFGLYPINLQTYHKRIFAFLDFSKAIYQDAHLQFFMDFGNMLMMNTKNTSSETTYCQMILRCKKVFRNMGYKLHILFYVKYLCTFHENQFKKEIFQKNFIKTCTYNSSWTLETSWKGIPKIPLPKQQKELLAMDFKV